MSAQKPVSAKPNQPAATKAAQAKSGVTAKGKAPPVSSNKGGQRKPQKADDSSKDLSRALGSNILLVGTLLIGGIVIATLTWRLASSPVEVIAVTESGQIIRPVPLPQAFVTDSRVLSFTSEALRDSFSHDFVNYRNTFARAKSMYYTTAGGNSFATAIDPILEELRTRRLVMTAAPLKAPSLTRGPYLQGGRAIWEVQAPISLFYEATDTRYPPQKRLATIKISRVDLAENPTGIGIDSIQLSPFYER